MEKEIKINIRHSRPSGMPDLNGAKFGESQEVLNRKIENVANILVTKMTDLGSKQAAGELLKESEIGSQNVEQAKERAREIVASFRKNSAEFQAGERTANLYENLLKDVKKVDELTVDIEKWKTEFSSGIGLSQTERTKIANEINAFQIEFDEYVKPIEDNLDANGFWQIEKEIGKTNFVRIDAQLDSLYEFRNQLYERVENGEVSPKILSELKECKDGFRLLLADVEKLKDERKEKNELLKENKDWKKAMQEAAENIEVFTDSKDEFERKYAKRKIQNNFPFNLKERLLEFAEKTDEEVREYNSSEWRTWRKSLGAAKMVNDPKVPKTIVIFENQAYDVDAVKKDIKKESDARTAINVLVGERIKALLPNIKEAKNLSGFTLGTKKNSDLRDLAFFVGKEVIEDQKVIERFIEEGNAAFLTKDEEQKIDTAITEKLINKAEGISEMVVRIFTYQKIDGALAKFAKKMPPGQRYPLKRELLDKIEFDEESKKIISEFIAKRTQDSTKGIAKAMEEEDREALESFIYAFVKKELEERKLLDSQTKDVKAASPEAKPETPEEKEKGKRIKEVEDALQKLQTEIERFPKKEKSDKEKDKKEEKKEEKDLKKEAEEIHAVGKDALRELKGADFDKNFTIKSEDIKKRLESKATELRNALMSEKSNAIDETLRAYHELNGDYELIKKTRSPKQIEEDKKFFEALNLATHELGEMKELDDAFRRKKADIEKRIKEKQEEIKAEVDKKKKEIEEKQKEKEKREKAVAENPEKYGVFEREKFARREGERTIDELEADLHNVRKKFNEVYSEKSEKYKTVLAGLGVKVEIKNSTEEGGLVTDKKHGEIIEFRHKLKVPNSRYEVLMEQDKDIAFYREEYRQVLENYLKIKMEGAQSRNDVLVEEIKKKAKPNWYQRQLHKFIDLLNEGSSQFIENKSPLEILNGVPAKVQAISKGNERRAINKNEDIPNISRASGAQIRPQEQEIQLEEGEIVENGVLQYAGGLDRLRRDLFKTMVTIVELEKGSVNSFLKGEKGVKVRDLKIADLLGEKNKKEFNKLPEDVRETIKRIARITSLDAARKNMPLRKLIAEALDLSKSNYEGAIILDSRFDIANPERE